jgi:hypothetical protein
MAVQAVAVVDLHHPISRRKGYSAIVVLVCLVSSFGIWMNRICTDESSLETKLGPDRSDANFVRARSVQLTALDHPHDIHRKLQHVDSQSYSQQEQRRNQLQGPATTVQPNSMPIRPSLPGQVRINTTRTTVVARRMARASI